MHSMPYKKLYFTRLGESGYESHSADQCLKNISVLKSKIYCFFFIGASDFAHSAIELS